MTEDRKERDESGREASSRSSRVGGIIHAYQKYDAHRFPSPTQPAPDLVSPLFEHMLRYGSYRPLTEEELARAVKIDPNQISGMGPSLEALIAMLRERKQRILGKYETDTVTKTANEQFKKSAAQVQTQPKWREAFQRAVQTEQIRDLENVWYQAGDDRSKASRQIMNVVSALGAKYLVEELASKYAFTGRTSLSVEEAIELKEELEKIDELIKQLEEAMKTAQIALIDLEFLEEFVEPGSRETLEEMQRMVENAIREQAERQGIERDGNQFRLTPKAYRIFQGKLLERIFSDLDPSRSGRHENVVSGEGAVELQKTKSYEFGDSLANMDIPQSFVNAMLRTGGALPMRLKQEDFVVHHTRNHPKCATAVIMDMSGSMRYQGQYVHVKRMSLAIDGLIRSEYPGDILHFIEMFTLAEQRRQSELIELMPKPVTLFDPVVRLKIDMSREDITPSMLPPHFTNIQRSLQMARRLLTAVDTPNRQVILITDGLPTAHYQDQWLYLLYPPDPLTESATLREAMACAQAGITINVFLVPSWSQSEEDIRFAYRIAESTKGRVFFTAGGDLDRYVVWDYRKRRREIIG